MSSPALHVKDSYYFEVPHALWQYRSLEQVPEFLRSAHPHASLAEFQNELDGKIIIPQPFGQLKNLYEKVPGSGFAVSKFMVLELAAALILLLVFTALARKYKTGDAPRGKFWNLFESVLLFVRDQIARPAIGEHDADKYVPLLWTVFFFILTLNLFGLLPWLGSATAAFSVTLALAATILLCGMGAGIKKFGIVGYWLNQIPHMDLPWFMAIILKPAIFVLEVGGLLIRHIVLAFRLLANMFAGHLVLVSIVALAFTAAGGLNKAGLVPVFFGVTALSFLELMVAFIQAYVFTFLSALFIGAAIHHH